ncbi:hypothetical protein GCM10010123_33310 [Pilimelia anulata]|uniref:CusB-like beta-barrel domain-containing protein n=1 Tax=Pilimelia anulata TaxID=53371 RepID=A0A8J3BE65_9ACTN|nr:HlyD family efflux transporter periplasmic adaptor subunit [Pilimelia anulata]GGK00736.1 hypothetical protein GCM10010123_33310 [Pilimelia anulata]
MVRVRRAVARPVAAAAALSARTKRPTLLVNAVLLVLVAGCGFWAYRAVTGGADEPAATGARTVPVLTGDLTATVEADGSVASALTAAADFTTSGTVTDIRVRVGQRVAKGATLATVDAAAARRGLTAARADLSAANDAVTRASDAGQDTSQAQAQVTEADLAVREARDAVAGATLTAPIAGTVTKINGSIGGSSGGSGSSGSSGGSTSGGTGGGAGNNSAGRTGTAASSASTGGTSGFIELADLGRLQVTASFAEADAVRLRVGQAATVTWNALADTRVEGKVVTIDPNATSSNGVVTYAATISLAERPAAARAGQTVTASVVTGRATDTVYVVAAAVNKAGNRRTVTVLENGRQTVRQVRVGLESAAFVEIAEGVEPGEQVVLPTPTGTGQNGRGQGGFGPGGFGIGGGGRGPGGGGQGGGRG